MMSAEIYTGFIPPSASREMALKFIRNYGREKDPSLPASPVPVEDLVKYADTAGLWFGPGVDVINFVFAKMYLGLLKIDPKNDSVSFAVQSPAIATPNTNH